MQVKIVSKGRDGYMGVGLCNHGVNMNRYVSMNNMNMNRYDVYVLECMLV